MDLLLYYLGHPNAEALFTAHARARALSLLDMSLAANPIAFSQWNTIMSKAVEAFGWESVTIDGHNIHQLIEALSHKAKGKPYAVIAKTVKGKGVSFIENNKAWHQAVLSEKLYQQAVEEIKNS